MLILIALIAPAPAQDCTIETVLVCDGVEVPPEPDGSYDLTPTCSPAAMDTGDTDAGIDTDTDAATDTGADTGLGYSFIPDYLPGPYSPGENTIFLPGQSLCLGIPQEQVIGPWWADLDDTGYTPEPPLIGRRYLTRDFSWPDGSWGERYGPETGLDQARDWLPTLDVFKECYGSTELENWLWTGGNQNPTPLLEVAFIRADQYLTPPNAYPLPRGYPSSTCLLLGTEESKIGNPTRVEDLKEFQDRLEARWATDGSHHLLMVVETVGDPTVVSLPYLDEVRAADIQAAAEDPDIVFIPAADIAADHLLPDGKHMSARGLHLAGVRCAEVAADLGYLTEAP